MIHLGGAQVSNPTRLCIHLLRAQGVLYNEPVFGCSSQAMHGHVHASSFGILKFRLTSAHGYILHILYTSSSFSKYATSLRHWSQNSLFYVCMSIWTDVLLTRDRGSCALLAINYEASAWYVSVRTALGLEAETTPTSVWGLWHFLCPRAAQRGERKKKETALTKIPQKAEKEGRAWLLGQKEVRPSQTQETAFLNEIHIITNQYELLLI